MPTKDSGIFPGPPVIEHDNSAADIIVHCVNSIKSISINSINSINSIKSYFSGLSCNTIQPKKHLSLRRNSRCTVPWYGIVVYSIVFYTRPQTHVVSWSRRFFVRSLQLSLQLRLHCCCRRHCTVVFELAVFLLLQWLRNAVTVYHGADALIPGTGT